MAANPKVSIDKTEADFLVDESVYLEAVSSQEVITPSSQNTEAGLLRTMQGRLAKAFINVFEFGVNQAGDDTVAMQSAFTAGAASTFYIPPGAYTLTGDVNVTAGAVVFATGVTFTGGKLTSTGEFTLLGLNAPIHVNINDLVTLVGDGSTDDEAAISAAIAALPNGSTLEFSGLDSHRAIGEILISGKNDLIIDGRGTLLNITAGFRLRGTNNRITIRNFRFDGSFSATSKCVFANDGTHTDIRIENLNSVDAGMGVQLTTGSTVVRPTIVHNTFVGCVMSNGTIELTNTGSVEAEITSNLIRDCVAGPGIRVACLRVTVTGNIIENHDAGDAAIYFDGARQCAATGNVVTDTELVAMQVTGGSSRIAVIGNVFVQSGTASGPTTIVESGIGSIMVKSNIVGSKPDHLEGAATPVGAVVPAFIGQNFLETTTPLWFKATGLTNADWVS